MSPDPKLAPDAIRKELLIDGYMYDVTEFWKRHPGGSVIKFGLGNDATDAFRQFHNRSEKAHKWLKTLPKRKVDEAGRKRLEKEGFFFGNSALLEDYRKLEAELKAEGVFDPSPLHVAWRILEIALIYAAGFGLMYAGNAGAGGFLLGTAMLYCGMAVVGVANGRCGWFMHEGGHHSLTGNWRIDVRIQEFFYGMGCGMSAAMWRNQHNKHHATPQKLQHDVDLDTLPLVAFNAKAMTHTRIGKFFMKNPVVRLWIRYQHLLFAPVTCYLVGLFWQCYLHPRFSWRRKHYAELAYYPLRALFFWVALPALMGGDWGWAYTAWAYFVVHQVGATMIFLNFAVSHTHLETVDKDDHRSWVEYSSRHTINLENTWWVNWWMSYLNFQIEHHLFPSCPQFRFPKIANRVRALFEKHGEPYHCLGYFEGMRVSFANLRDVAEESKALKPDTRKS